MNKALEIIEARWLFDIKPQKISVMIHPQSIIHSIVEYRDGSMIAQMGVPDMRVPISYALAYPERLPGPKTALNLEKVKKLTFEKPSSRIFPTLKLAYDALQKGDTACVALNAANEVSVKAFLCGRIKFLDISKIIGRVLREDRGRSLRNLDEAISVHNEYKTLTERLIGKL
jgi:1-deoxy-D-xylulose-5-phosphate reductoisomerase